MTEKDAASPSPWSAQGQSAGNESQPAESQPAQQESVQQYNPYSGHQHPYQYPGAMPPVPNYAPRQYAPNGPRPAGRKGTGKLMAGVAAVALVVGGFAGGVGGYLAGDGVGPGSPVSSLAAPRPAKQTGNAPAGSIEAVAEKVTPSVVQLQVVGNGVAGEGSGFVITDDGYIITNNHVIEAAADGGRITVVFHDGRRAQGEVVGRDPTTDIAVVRAVGVSDLTPVELGRSDDLRVGQSVVAIGSPYDLSGTVTAGIISSLNRPVRAGGASGDQATVMDAIQTDAAINPGNSGGPLVDMTGRVIGINSAIYSPRSASEAGNVGIGFAIPIDQARRTADEIIESGRATQTYIGATVTDGRNGGSLIREVLKNTPAEKAGLKSGDVVVKLDDRVISGADELVAAIRTQAPGEEVTLTLDGGRK
ncbi:MAG: trypsin-like peptidase domain-containing protein, partial [Pseudonocardiaceae bacterium]